ncbi:transcriptional regulator ATRX homolog isoform X4 [Drosophila kikkawai]|uniref:Transcriptional regulator ATRX homolog isoform X4 n=1 Tax=Drosophila kikkawai TaxID=30033 RepID=A0ABM4GAI3_DROKI
MKELSTFHTEQKDSENTTCEMLVKSEISFEQEQITVTAYAEFPNEDTNQIEIDTGPDDNISIEDLLKLPCKNQFPKEYNNYQKCDTTFSDALSDHNYTSQKLIMSQHNLRMVRDILKVIVPSSSMKKNIETHIWNFFKNTIHNSNFYKIKSTDDKNTHLNQSQTYSISDSSQSRNTEGIRENFSDSFNVNENYLTNMHNDFENQHALNPLLISTIHFAKQLYYESMTFALKTEDELKTFIIEKLKKFKEIAMVGCAAINESTDINSEHSMNKYQSNFEAKMNLLWETSESSHTDIDLESTCDELKIESRSEKSMRLLTEPYECTSSKILNLQHNFSDNIDLSNYIKLDIIGKTLSNALDEHSENKYSCLTDNDTDKEIERLINLNVLSIHKQQKTQIHHRKKDIEKLMEKRELKSTLYLEDELDMNESEPIYHNKKNSITEVEFISRYNEQIKHQLLNDSNSDSGLSNQSNYGNSKDSAPDFTTNTVDKFLHAFESDSNLLFSTQKNKNKNTIKEITTEFRFNSNANDSIINTPKTSKLYSDSELKHPSSILLSSESDDSDMEHKVQQSRFIKPMLRIDQLAIETRAAQKDENERIRRLEKKSFELSKALKNRTTFTIKTDLILDYIESTKTFIAVDKDIVKQLKPHQKDGVKFMYDSCYGGTDLSNTNSGSGCILAHCMGLGKTLQLIALLHTVISYEELNTYKMLVLCPKSTVMNWADEFHHWLSPLKSKNTIKVFLLPDSSDVSEKLLVLKEWSLSTKGKAGCLLMGYEAFRALVFYHSYKYKGCGTTSKLENIRDKVKKYLLQPGADIVVCDEGHIIKNSKSAVSLAVAKINTPKRIILTGTPIQNNLKEYYSMVNFIKPLYLGTEREFANLYANPIKNGQHKDSSKKDITIMKQRSYVLHKKLSKFVQQKGKKDKLKISCPNSDEDQPDDIYDSQTGVMSVTNDWWRKYLVKQDLETIVPSNKLRVMFSILHMCAEKGEKCLIFSAFVAVLNVVEYFFKKVSESNAEMVHLAHTSANHKTSNKWISGQDYYRLDGKTPKNIRHEMIKRFNCETNRRARVFLISSRAGGQGINLIGANRVIILDTSWNPSNDQQNIFRIFRLGQKKNCYVYRLIAMGTMEEKVYSRSVTKQAMSFRVVDEQQIDRHYNMAELAELYTLTIPQKIERTVPVLPKDTILADLLRQSDLVYKYHEHDSLLENKVEQELSEQEKSDAWDTYEKELHLNFEQKGNMDMEKLENNISISGLSSYSSNFPNFSMQTLLNYSLGPSFNYSLNQNYYDGLKYYQKYSPHQIDLYLKDQILNSSSYGNPIFTNTQSLPDNSSSSMISNLRTNNLHNISSSTGVSVSFPGNSLSTLEHYQLLLGNSLNYQLSNSTINYPNQSDVSKKGISQKQIESSSIEKHNINICDDYFNQNVVAHPQPNVSQSINSVDCHSFSDSKRPIQSKETNETAQLTNKAITNKTCKLKENNTLSVENNNSLTENISTQKYFSTNIISKESRLPVSNSTPKQLYGTPSISLISIDTINHNNTNNVQIETESRIPEKNMHLKRMVKKSIGPKLTSTKLTKIQKDSRQFEFLTSISSAISKNVNQETSHSELHTMECRQNVPSKATVIKKSSLTGGWKKNDKPNMNEFINSLLKKSRDSDPVKYYEEKAIQNKSNQHSEHLHQGFDESNARFIRKTILKRPTADEKDCNNQKRFK